MREYQIQKKQGKKGRTFKATLVSAVTCDGLFPEGRNGDTHRPVWAMFAGSETALRPFVANLRLGRKAEPADEYHYRGGDSGRFEFLKSLKYGLTWQKEDEGCLATFHHPELFRLDPGMVDPDGIKFILLVPHDWLEDQQVDREPAAEHLKNFSYPHLNEETLKYLVPTAYLFAAYLDRRTRCPLVTDGRFYLQLLCAALDKGLASLCRNNLRDYGFHEDWGVNQAHSFRSIGLEEVGIGHAISFMAKHEDFETFVAEQVETFFDLTEEKPQEAANG